MKKVKIPRYVAEWYEKSFHEGDTLHKKIYCTSRQGCGHGLSSEYNWSENDRAPSNVSSWVSMNKTEMINALINGYEIEETEVTWQEAIQAWVDGKEIKMVLDKKEYAEPLIMHLYEADELYASREYIENGEWYIL